MFILKLAGKILLLPVWLILFVIGLAVKMTVKELIDSYKTLVGQTDSESSDENSDLVSEENATDEDSNSADNTDNTNGVDVD